MKKSYLVLQSGMIFEGLSPDWQEGSILGEVVFTTGMTGYDESLTDPSFAGQLLTFTYPLIGNYGVAAQKRKESPKIHAKGVILSDVCMHYSHYESVKTLLEWFKEEKVPCIFGIDTRALTKILRTEGNMLGQISDNKTCSFHEKAVMPSARHVSPKLVARLGKGKKRIIAVDCGMKESMLKSLLHFDLEIFRVPYDYDYSSENFDGIFLSNGPGDPMECTKTIDLLRKAMAREKPIFGVCLGNQLLALAAGASTYKLKFGHRGQNQPCIECETEKCYITSQNHGFAVDEKTLSKEWKVTFRNLNDHSVEGISHIHKPFFAVQFHPEASPGPTDTRFLFEKFCSQLSG